MEVRPACGSLWEGRWRYTGLVGTAGVTGGHLGATAQLAEDGGPSAAERKHIAAKNRGKVFSSPADVYIGGRRWQYARKSKNSLEQSPEQPHLRLKLTLF